MIIIPEIETVVILVPKTGSGTLRHVISRCYPNSMLLYHHMEADGIPLGYTNWRKIGVVRNPLHRMWSTYKFLKETFGTPGPHDSPYAIEVRKQIDRPFEDWLLNNDKPFITPFDNSGSFKPVFNVLHLLPENKKSQKIYLRPDLGTEIIPFGSFEILSESLKLSVEIFQEIKQNSTAKTPIPFLSQEGLAHIDKWFSWDNKIGGV